jgi:hypothetical protein
VVFRDLVNDAVEDGILSLALICLRELGGLPFNILWEFWHELERKETSMTTSEKTLSESGNDKITNQWDASASTLPFLLAGVLFMVMNLDLPFHVGYPTVAFLAICLLGLWIGLLHGFPRWAFSYLGWSVVMTWWWTAMPLFTFSALYDPRAMPERMGLLAWIPLLLVLGLGLWMGRSTQPLRKLTSAIWRDWTLLSLSIYTFAAFTLLIYDENHHPYLPAFMAAGTLVICLAVWSFMQSNPSWKRVLFLTAGFVAALAISNISYATWDYAAYYNLPPSTPQPWYQELLGMIPITLFWVVFVFWPALIGLIHYIVSNRNKPGMA